MMTYLWIVGEKALNEFCRKRYGMTPEWMETIGRLGDAKVRLIYKHDEENNRYVDCYLLYMPTRKYEGKNVVSATQLFNEIQRWTYEEIRVDRSTLRAR